jgi:hypothetical protein
VLLFLAIALLIWVIASLVVAPLLGTAIRRCELEEHLNSVEVLRSRAQHPTSHAA